MTMWAERLYLAAIVASFVILTILVRLVSF
jgi:hypothetical protein